MIDFNSPHLFQYEDESVLHKRLQYVYSWDPWQQKNNPSHHFNQITEFAHPREEEYFNDKKWHDKQVYHGWKNSDGSPARKIEYHYDKWGFRNHVIKKNPDIVILGCSQSFGIGMDHERIFPHIVSTTTGLTYRNLSIPGGSLESSYRVLKTWIPTLLPKLVLLAYPASLPRREFISPRSTIDEASPRWKQYENLWSGEEIYIANVRAVDGIKYLCHQYNSKLITMNLTFEGLIPYNEKHNVVEITNPQMDLNGARDMQHAGAIEHKIYSHDILSQI